MTNTVYFSVFPHASNKTTLYGKVAMKQYKLFESSTLESVFVPNVSFKLYVFILNVSFKLYVFAPNFSFKPYVF